MKTLVGSSRKKKRAVFGTDSSQVTPPPLLQNHTGRNSGIVCSLTTKQKSRLSLSHSTWKLCSFSCTSKLAKWVVRLNRRLKVINTSLDAGDYLGVWKAPSAGPLHQVTATEPAVRLRLLIERTPEHKKCLDCGSSFRAQSIRFCLWFSGLQGKEIACNFLLCLIQGF